MKRLITSVILTLSIVMCWAGNKVWKKADIVAAYSNYLSIGSVTLADTATVVEVIATKPGDKFRFSKDTFLDCGDGSYYKVKACKEYVLGSWIPGEGKDVVIATFVFEPMPKSTKVFDLIEGYGSNMFKIYGIHDCKKPLKIQPFTYDSHALDDYRKNFFRTAEVCVRGRFEKKPKEKTGIIYLKDLFSDKDMPLTIDVNEDGTFERRFSVHHPIANTIHFNGKNVPFYVEPGHTIDLQIRKDGQVEYTDEQGNSAPGAAYLSSNVNGMFLPSWAQREEVMKSLSFVEYGQMIDSLMVKADEKMAYFAHRNHFTPLDYALARTDVLCDLGYTLLDADMYSRHHNIDSANMAELKDLANYKPLRRLPFNDPIMLVSVSYRNLQNCYSFLNVIHPVTLWREVRDTEGGFVSRGWNEPEVRDSLLADIDSKIFGQKGMSMLAKIHMLNTLCKRDLSRINFRSGTSEETKAKVIAQREEKGRRSVSRMKEMIGEEVFSTHIDRIYQHYLDNKDYTYTLPDNEGTAILRNITDSFLNKYVFLDFWATTCGPCRAGIERTKVVRDAMRDNREVVFLFLTSESESPQASYDDYVEKHLKGEHVYRLPASDYNKLRELFQINGIPHYEVLTKSGAVIRDNAWYSDLDSFNRFLEIIKDRVE